MQGYIAQRTSSPKVRLTIVRYVVVLLCVVAGVSLAFSLHAVLEPAVLLLIAVLVSAWFSGLWPALVGSLLATVALDYFFTPPLRTFTLEFSHIPRLAAFTVVAALAASASAARRSAERSLKEARDELETRVRARTADLTRANERLAIQYSITRVLAQSESLDQAAPQLLEIIGTTMGWRWGALWKLDRDAAVLRCERVWHEPNLDPTGLEGVPGITFAPGRGLPGHVWQTGRPHWITDVTQDASFVRAASAARGGLRGAIAFPILVKGDDPVGVIEFFSGAVREPNQEELDTLSAIGSQLGQFIERKRAERALREQAALLDLTHDTVFVRDLNDVITYWNRGAEETYGWTRTEAIGKVSHELTQTVFPAPLETLMAQLLRTGRWEGELLHRKRDGSQLVVASRWSLQRGADGQPLAILETNNDITERKRAEEALRESKEQWEAVFENNPTMYFMVDPEGVVVSVNPFGAEQLGYTVPEIVGRPVQMVFLPEDREAVRRTIDQCVEQLGRVLNWEMRKVRKDGTVIWVRETAKAMHRTKGDPIVLIACEDMTARKRAEAELWESERRHRHIFHGTGTSIWEEDFSQVKAAIDALRASGVRDFREYLRTTPSFVEQAISLVRVVDVNEATLNLFGAGTKAELIGSLHKVFTAETRDVFAGELIAIAEGQSSFEGETVLQSITGDRIAVLFSVSFPPPDSAFDAVLVSVTDITDRKRAEQELEELAGRLIHAQEQERSRIGRELHDHISQMLGVLTIKVDQLRADGATPPNVAAALDELRQNTVEITEDVHRLSHRLHSSTLDYLGLGPALQKLVSEFSERHGISIEFTHALPPTAIPSDVALCLFRVTEESLNNIAKHSHAASAHVDVSAGPDGIHLSVEDTGHGFDVTALETRAGLGFVSMRERLRVLRGTVHIDSAPTRGTRIDVWVPAANLGTGDAAEPIRREGTQPPHLRA